MKKLYLAFILFLFATPTFACECHGSGYSSGGFRGFAGWQLPTQNCDPSHVSMNKGEVSYEDMDSATPETSASEPETTENTLAGRNDLDTPKQ